MKLRPHQPENYYAMGTFLTSNRLFLSRARKGMNDRSVLPSVHQCAPIKHSRSIPSVVPPKPEKQRYQGKYPIPHSSKWNYSRRHQNTSVKSGENKPSHQAKAQKCIQVHNHEWMPNESREAEEEQNSWTRFVQGYQYAPKTTQGFIAPKNNTSVNKIRWQNITDCAPFIMTGTSVSI